MVLLDLSIGYKILLLLSGPLLENPTDQDTKSNYINSNLESNLLC